MRLSFFCRRGSCSLVLSSTRLDAAHQMKLKLPSERRRFVAPSPNYPSHYHTSTAVLPLLCLSGLARSLLVLSAEGLLTVHTTPQTQPRDPLNGGVVIALGERAFVAPATLHTQFRQIACPPGPAAAATAPLDLIASQRVRPSFCFWKHQYQHQIGDTARQKNALTAGAYVVESVEVVSLDGEGMDVAAAVKTRSFFGKVGLKGCLSGRVNVCRGSLCFVFG